MKKLRYLLSLIGLLCGMQLCVAQAPKPSIQFRIKFADEGQKKSLFMVLHQESDTSGRPKEIEQNSKSGNYFDTSEICMNSAYCRFSSHLKKYHHLAFVYADRNAITDDIEPDAYHSLFEVYVSGPKMEVKNITPWFLRTSKPYTMYRTILVSLLVELLVLWLVLLILRYPNKLRFLAGMFLANLIGLPVFFGLMELSDTSLMWFVAEVLMIAIETLFVWWFMKKAATLGKMTLLVFLLNLFSVFAGGAVLFFAMLFGQDIIQYLQ